jgi:hypothetical protein
VPAELPAARHDETREAGGAGFGVGWNSLHRLGVYRRWKNWMHFRLEWPPTPIGQIAFDGWPMPTESFASNRKMHSTQGATPLWPQPAR